MKTNRRRIYELEQQNKHLTRGLRATGTALTTLWQRLDKLENKPANPELDQLLQTFTNP